MSDSSRSSSTRAAAVRMSPVRTTLLAMKFKANCSCTSAPDARVTFTCRSAKARPVSKSQASTAMIPAARFPARHKRPSTSSGPISWLRAAASARVSVRCGGLVAFGHSEREGIEKQVSGPWALTSRWGGPSGLGGFADQLLVIGSGTPRRPRREPRNACRAQAAGRTVPAAGRRSAGVRRRLCRGVGRRRFCLATGRQERCAVRMGARDSTAESSRSAESSAPAARFALAAAKVRSARRAPSGVRSAARSSSAAAARRPPRAFARPADCSSSTAIPSSWVTVELARCQARLSASPMGSVTSASARCTARRFCMVRRAIGGRAHRGMTKVDMPSELRSAQRALLGRRHSSRVRVAWAADHSSAGSPFGSAAASASRVCVSAGNSRSRLAKPSSSCPLNGTEADSESPSTNSAAVQARGQLQQGKRISARLGDDPIPDHWICRSSDHRIEQPASVLGAETRRAGFRKPCQIAVYGAIPSSDDEDDALGK